MIRLEPKPKSQGLKRRFYKRKLTTKPLKKSPLKPLSKNMIKQRREENKLSLKLAELSGNRCEICGVYKPPMGLAKHEIIKRSHQGEECNPLNTLLLCTSGCHNHVKYPKSGTPLSIEEQLALAKKLHENIL